MEIQPDMHPIFIKEFRYGEWWWIKADYTAWHQSFIEAEVLTQILLVKLQTA